MSKQSKEELCKQLYEQFLNLNPRDLDTMELSLSDFDGLNLAEARKTLSFVLQTLDGLIQTNTWSELSWNAFGVIENLLLGLLNSYSQLRTNLDQNSWSSFAAQLDVLAYHLRLFGVPAMIADGLKIEHLSSSLSTEMERLTLARTDVEKLRDEVKALVAPAVAGSLSQAFTARKRILLWGRMVWGAIALALGAYCIHATYSFAAAVGEAAAAVGSAAAASKPATGSGNLIWLSVLIRSVVLVPLYAAFGFSFAQYKKERDFEEEYAHKAAVAASLPNYGDLTREPAVRDQIVTGATNVIFAIPTSRTPEKEKSEKILGGMKELLDSVAKLVPSRNGS